MKTVKISAKDQRWSIHETAVPEPGIGQVLIRVGASGVCRNDLNQPHGVPGHEIAGEIVDCGEAVSSRRIGDRVGVLLWQSACGRCEWCERGRSLDCPDRIGTSIHRPGGHAEYVIADADGTVLLPDGLSFEQAAPLMCAGFAAYSGLRSAEPRPGERVAIAGIGGIGHLAVQYAANAGFRTIVVSRTPGKEAVARQLGADDFVRDMAELESLGGADVLMVTSSNPSAKGEILRGLRPGGRLVLIGIGAEPLAVSTGELVVKRLRVIGSQHNDRDDLYEALALGASGQVTALTETFKLDDAALARQCLADGTVRFRAVLVP